MSRNTTIETIPDIDEKSDDIIINLLNRKFNPDREYESDPFSGTIKFKLTTELTKIKDTEKILIDTKANTKEKIVLASETNLDRTPFMKFYSIKFLGNLSKAALRIFLYICEEKLEYNNNKIEFDVSAYSKKYGDLPSKIYPALKELRNNQIIARTKFSGIYFINSSLFFKGERRFFIWKEQNRKD